MKHPTRMGLGAALMLICAGTLSADAPTAPQEQVSFAAGASGTWNLDWAGVDGRVYFVQWSVDLVHWNYLPLIEAGEGTKSFGAASSSGMLSLRLHYANFDPEDPDYLDPEHADYDHDGMNNLFEVMNGFDPFVPNVNPDPDEDGANNTNERNAGTDPNVKDHPAVKLSVMVTGI